MLSSASTYNTMALADQLDATGVILQPLSGSPLDHLVKASGVTSDLAYRQEDGTVNIDFWRLENQANAIDPLFEKSKHDYVLDDITKVAGESVQRAIALIRTVVAPQIGTLVEQVTNRMQGLTPSQLANMQIVTDETASALYNPALVKLIEKFELQPPVEPDMNTALPRLSAPEIMPLLETGIASLDTDIAEWITTRPAYELENIWNAFFSVLTARENSSDNLNVAVASPPGSFSSQIDTYNSGRLIVFLLARHMLENDVVIEGTEMPLAKLRDTLTAYQEQAGRLLNRQMEMNSASIRNGVLVKSVTSNQIVVNTPVYTSWLNNGGDNDILFGMAVSGKPNFLLAQIDEKRDEYRQAWNSYSALITATDSNRRFNYVREQLVLCYEDMLSNEEKEGVKLDTREVFEIMKTFKNQLNEITVKDTEDLYALCMRLICRTRYEKTPAERFLTKMEEVSKSSPNLSPREAGTIAALEYICDWVAEQFIVAVA